MQITKSKKKRFFDVVVRDTKDINFYDNEQEFVIMLFARLDSDTVGEIRTLGLTRKSGLLQIVKSRLSLTRGAYSDLKTKLNKLMEEEDVVWNQHLGYLVH